MPAAKTDQPSSWWISFKRIKWRLGAPHSSFHYHFALSRPRVAHKAPPSGEVGACQSIDWRGIETSVCLIWHLLPLGIIRLNGGNAVLGLWMAKQPCRGQPRISRQFVQFFKQAHLRLNRQA